MARLTRVESQAQTRQKLLDAARDMFSRDGYAATSIDRIADAAGFSKGAVYSNFAGKEAIFLEVLEALGQASLGPLLEAIDIAPGADAVVELLVAWADDRSQSGNWSLTILEHARTADRDAQSLERQREILRSHWRQLGERLVGKFPEVSAGPEILGALIHELAYAPAMTFVSRPRAGDLVRLSLKAILA